MCIMGKALSRKILMAWYYWPSMLQDYAWFVNHCEKCQIYTPFMHSPAKLLHSIISPSPFYQWGSDILRPFPLAVGQLKFLIVAVDYFTKWVETIPRIIAERVRSFSWRNIICHFGLPGVIISDNVTQFASLSVVAFCRHLGIHNRLIYVEHL